MTVAEIIRAVRGLDASFDPRRHPDQVVLDFLSRYQRELAAKMLQRERQSISAEITIPMPLDDFEAGEQLLDGSGDPLEYDMLHDLTAVLADGTEVRVYVMPVRQRFQQDRWPFAWIAGGYLHLGGFESWWSPAASLLLTYAPTVAELTAYDDALSLPASAHNVLVLAAGAELVRRDPEHSHRKTLPAEADRAEESYLNLIEERAGAVEVGIVRRVFS